jgi:hypothetical protein
MSPRFSDYEKSPDRHGSGPLHMPWQATRCKEPGEFRRIVFLSLFAAR